MTDKLDRCVVDVKKQGNVDNPWAVCNASIDESIMKEVLETKLKGCGCQKKKLS